MPWLEIPAIPPISAPSVETPLMLESITVLFSMVPLLLPNKPPTVRLPSIVEYSTFNFLSQKNLRNQLLLQYFDSLLCYNYLYKNF